MSETQNTQQNNGEQGAPSSDAPRSTLKKLWGYLNAFLDYVDEEVPAPPRTEPESGASGSKPKKAWAKFNAFLDSLDEPDPESPEQPLPGDGEQCGCLLRKTGRFCRSAVFPGAILVALFALTLLVTIKVVDFVNSKHVPFYPSREVMMYLTAEHESLEKIADSLPAGEISPEEFGEQCIAVVKPVRIYSDEYGVYLMTSKNEYVGENGIFIVRDGGKMPDELSWGLIKGRVFTYAFFK